MGGFDNGTAQSGVRSQAKQFGPILRGSGPPIPQAAVMGDLYIDTSAFTLYAKRSDDAGSGVDPWGHYLFPVFGVFQTHLRWFSAVPPDDSIGVAGDYCLLWAGFGNYGLLPSIYGPKNAFGTWSENGEGPTTTIAISGVFPLGLSGEGVQTTYSPSTQLIVAGLVDEYILPIPVPNFVGTPIGEIGLRSIPVSVAALLNPLYTAEDRHGI